MAISRKRDVPLREDADVERLVQTFEALTLPCEHWTHRAHLAVAVTYLRRYGYQRALAELRLRINAYNAACANPDGYSETITILFLRKVEAESRRPRCQPTLHGEVNRLASLCRVEWIDRFYSRHVIHSPEARRRWVEPDLMELDFQTED